MSIYIEQLTAHIRLADLLDVGVIAVLIYCGLSWFRQRTSRSLLVGLMLVAGLYLCARWTDMYMTTKLFQAGFTVVMLALIVVFQEDIRRAFERLTSSGFFGESERTEPNAENIDILVESVGTLAADRTGALFVFAGREPLERHVRGGVAVDSLISLPLLYSIFHPESPGHDGAILIDSDRISELGVHLPLSKNLAEVGPGGTRHAAALGLAERSDALVVVVSEERGTISIAEHGQIRKIEPAELTTRLERYYRDRFLPAKESAWHRGVTRSIGLKMTALAMACSLWLLLAYRVETVQRTFVVPIEYRNLPETMVIAAPRPTHAELMLSGSERAFDMLEASKLAVSFDLEHVRSATPYSLRTQENLKGLPDELNVNQIQPAKVTITLQHKPLDES